MLSPRFGQMVVPPTPSLSFLSRFLAPPLLFVVLVKAIRVNSVLMLNISLVLVLHHTHPACAILYRWRSHFARSFAIGCSFIDSWDDLWAARFTSTGAVSSPLAVLDYLRIVWSDPYTLVAGMHSFDIRPGADYYTNAPDPCDLPRKSAGAVHYAHALRLFLRRALARRLSIVRPADFDGLEFGVSENSLVRRTLFSFMHRAGGPTLLCAGAWSGALISTRVSHGQSGACPRCGAPIENLRHRLWDCPRNQIFRQWLNQRLAQPVALPDDLPICFQRAGIPPANLGLAPCDIAPIAEYIWMAVLVVPLLIVASPFQTWLFLTPA